MSGWVKVHRELLEWEWWTDHNTTRLFMYLLMKVNHVDKRWQGQEVKAGSLVTSIPSLMEGTGLSAQNVRTSLTKLVSTKEVTDKPTNKYRVVTLTQWAKYQDGNRQLTDNLTDNQQTTNRQLTATKEGKKERRKEERSILYPLTPKGDKLINNSPEVTMPFDIFKRAWGRKGFDKTTAYEIWIKLECYNHLDEYLKQLEVWKNSQEWKEGYRPKASNFLKDYLEKDPEDEEETVY